MAVWQRATHALRRRIDGSIARAYATPSFVARHPAGMPAATCGETEPTRPEEKVVCTSRKIWGNATTPPPPKPDDDDDDDDEWEDSPLMNPGRACVECHVKDDGPRLAFGGTLYPTLREPDDCYGTNGLQVPLRVVVTDATGKEVTAVVNETGNFYLESKRSPLAYPIRAKVIGSNGERAMKDPVDHGDCNLCHGVATSSKAPGRILGP